MSDRVTFVGSVKGTGATLPVTKLGFRPRVVKLINTASGGLATLYWNAAMADDTGFKEQNHATVQRAFLTSLGITPLANGFSIGADTDINVDGEDIVFEAVD